MNGIYLIDAGLLWERTIPPSIHPFREKARRGQMNNSHSFKYLQFIRVLPIISNQIF